MKVVAKVGLLLLVVLVALGACKGQPGQPYLQFSWTYAPTVIYCTAPGLPSTVYDGVEFATEEGTWYASYYHNGYNNPGYYIYFTITAHEGTFLQDGEDSLFEIYTYRDGPPTFSQYYSLTGSAESAPEGFMPEQQVNVARTPPDMTGFEPKQLGTFDQVRGGYRYQGTYGTFVPKS